MTTIPHDPDSLWMARVHVRVAYERVRQLRQADPTIRVVADELDRLAVEITEAIELENPRLPLEKAG